MTGPTPSRTPVLTDADLTTRWREVLSTGGGPDPSARTLWTTFFSEDGVQLPVLLPMDGAPARPDPAEVDGLMAIGAQVVDEHCSGLGSVAMALERPGPAAATAVDRAWARALQEAAVEHGVRARVLHVAGPGWVLPVG